MYGDWICGLGFRGQRACTVINQNNNLHPSSIINNSHPMSTPKPHTSHHPNRGSIVSTPDDFFRTTSFTHKPRPSSNNTKLRHLTFSDFQMQEDTPEPSPQVLHIDLGRSQMSSISVCRQLALQSNKSGRSNPQFQRVGGSQ